MKSKKILCCILASMIIASTTVSAALSVSAVNNNVLAVSDSIAEENNITADYTAFLIGYGNKKQLTVKTNSTSENVRICREDTEIASTANPKQVTIQDGVVTVNNKVFLDAQEMEQNITLVFDDGTLNIKVFSIGHDLTTPYSVMITEDGEDGFGETDLEKDEETGLYHFELTNNPSGQYTVRLYEWDKDSNFAVVKNSVAWSYQNDNEEWVADVMVTYDEATNELTAVTTNEYNPNDVPPIELTYEGDWGYYILDEWTTVIGAYEGTEEAEVTVPSTLGGTSVTQLGENLFKDHTEITNITLPETLNTIANNAFDNCAGLLEIQLPSSVTSIGSEAFKDCCSLTEFQFPKNVDYCGVSVFENCYNLTTVTLSSKMNSISDGMFKNCKCLTGITLPDKIYDIGNNAFENCKSLETVDFSKNIQFLGMSAFKNCTALSGEITLTDVGYISTAAFYNCCKLQKVTFTSQKNIVDDNALIIDALAFGNCISLSEVDFLMTNNVTVKKTAFFNCLKAKTVHYTGSHEQWKNNVKIELLGNLFFKGAKVYYDNVNYAEFDKTEVTVNNGEIFTLTYHSAPYSDKESEFESMTWTSSNPDVATVDGEGIVTTKATGTTDITLVSTTVTGYTHETVCKVSVVKPTESITLNKTAVNIGVSQKYTLTATVTPDEASKVIKWSSSDKDIATVNKDGVVTGKMTGTVTITAKTWDGKKVTCKVTVKKAPKTIALDKETLTLKVDGSYTFTKTTTPNSATSYKWTSSDPDVVRVYSTGKIVAQKSGTAVITVTTHNGKTASCTVTVK